MPDNTAPKQDTRFKPGRSGNPRGRPKGSRNKLSEDFFKALAADFATHGKAAIKAMREDRPQDYARMVASLQPKEVDAEVIGEVIATVVFKGLNG